MSRHTAESLPALLRDLGKAALVGAGAAGAVGSLFFGGGLLLGAHGAASGLEASKDALFAAAAVLLFILAGLLMLKGKKPEGSGEENGWRRHFALIGPKLAIGAIAAAFILAAAAVDYIQLSL